MRMSHFFLSYSLAWPMYKPYRTARLSVSSLSLSQKKKKKKTLSFFLSFRLSFFLWFEYYSIYFIGFNICCCSSSFVQPITTRDEVNKREGWNYFETEKLVSHYW